MSPDLELLLPSWELHLRAERKSPATIKSYGEGVRRYLEFCASGQAEPLARTDKIVVINSGGDAHSGTGASRVTRDVTDTVAQLPAVIEALTGLDLMALLRSLPAVKDSAPQAESDRPAGGPADAA